MALQPFGYHFEVHSALSPDAVKAAIRSRKKRWFDAKDGARGWIVGPFICLQSSMWRNAPILLGRISRDNLGTRISGRAGYLGSIFGLLILTPFPVAFLYLMLATGDYSLKSIALSAVLIAFISLVFWIDHRDAEPLVRFLRDTVGPHKSPRVQPVATKFSKGLRLEISGSILDDPVTPDSVRDALFEVEGDGFVILSSGEETYIQTVGEMGGYIVEKREGSDLHHYRAVRRGAVQADDTEIFSFEEALAVFFAYGSAAPMPPFLEWKSMRL